MAELGLWPAKRRRFKALERCDLLRPVMTVGFRAAERRSYARSPPLDDPASGRSKSKQAGGGSSRAQLASLASGCRFHPRSPAQPARPDRWRGAPEVLLLSVNNPNVMPLMVERGVGNVITDDASLLAQVIEERKALRGLALLKLRLRVLFDMPPRGGTGSAAVKPR